MIFDLRHARSTDAGRTGEILYQYFEAAPWSENPYTVAEIIGYCGRMIEDGWVTVGEMDGRIEGFLARNGEEICALYLSSKVNGQGLGRILLDHAKTEVGKLRLTTEQANIGAQRFYQREGFVEVSRSDGAENDENLPDITYVWPKEAATT